MLRSANGCGVARCLRRDASFVRPRGIRARQLLRAERRRLQLHLRAPQHPATVDAVAQRQRRAHLAGEHRRARRPDPARHLARVRAHPRRHDERHQPGRLPLPRPGPDRLALGVRPCEPTQRGFRPRSSSFPCAASSSPYPPAVTARTAPRTGRRAHILWISPIVCSSPVAVRTPFPWSRRGAIVRLQVVAELRFVRVRFSA